MEVVIVDHIKFQNIANKKFLITSNDNEFLKIIRVLYFILMRPDYTWWGLLLARKLGTWKDVKIPIKDNYQKHWERELFQTYSKGISVIVQEHLDYLTFWNIQNRFQHIFHIAFIYRYKIKLVGKQKSRDGSQVFLIIADM